MTIPRMNISERGTVAVSHAFVLALRNARKRTCLMDCCNSSLANDFRYTSSCHCPTTVFGRSHSLILNGLSQTGCPVLLRANDCPECMKKSWIAATILWQIEYQTSSRNCSLIGHQRGGFCQSMHKHNIIYIYIHKGEVASAATSQMASAATGHHTFSPAHGIYFSCVRSTNAQLDLGTRHGTFI
jgi:hypothetical protein